MQAILNGISNYNSLQWNIYMYSITRILLIARISEIEFEYIQMKMLERFECDLIHTPEDIYISFKIACLLLRPIQYWQYLGSGGIF
jgi:hypothetical protein